MLNVVYTHLLELKKSSNTLKYRKNRTMHNITSQSKNKRLNLD